MADDAAEHPVWPGARLTFERLGLFLDWEPLPPPSGEPPLELQYALLQEKRQRDMALCPVEAQALQTPPEGRRSPPRYGVCEDCGWMHAMPGGGVE